MKILALDTSGLVCTVAVTEDDRLLSEFSIQHKITHSELLLPMMEQIKNRISLDLNTIDAVAVSAGPGSFTGLRIGCATAKGLCLAMNKPMVAVPTLDAMAYQFYGSEYVICPMMDARRNQVYTGVYIFVPEKENEKHREIFFSMKTIKAQSAMSVNDIAEELNNIGKTVILLGDGIPVYRDKLEELLKVNYILVPAHMNRQRASALAALATIYLREGKTVDADSFSPEYLRASQAEREAAEKAAGKKETKADSGKNGRKSGIASPIYIRDLKAEDITAAAEIEKACLGAEAWTEKQLLEAATRDDTVYLVAEVSGEVAGLCGVRNISGEGEVTNVSVSESSRGKGIAFEMLSKLLLRGKAIGCESFTLEVRGENKAARGLYEKLGFVNEGTRPGFYESPKDDAIIYWKRNNTND
ncbi:tRNA (adenosine(37)-N6)-threonylcarbamoyltransferase complex dimerization subunit type 1 TsaB [Butyrivibrio sp. INlla16]|uniref:tRNA (adenosine(37)-N6)-threonylcarbamoyltransferase complex dimerization subunit type 1 TsaB n=1 Tax=Butyrivibrio sp. INlla16 TaxID=1520807 RepID=UPI00088530D3|nr:tRNA (adenosine(37)-N6)-threonylcarbamoyltransferase complex dimerization subunit type 1 TsaB [Butyrivibrio sp. INlla16]SDB46459.1 ribosomal-protein-alanine acetyltransferase/tRNA threonylcarbamoyl adenosine modification protein YeaZ,TIGR03725 [Butyrivibrio sp. INlla16]